MSLYLFKLILIVVFDIGVNTYYINSGCNCSCKSNKNNSGGGIQGDIFAIDLDEHTLKCNGKIFSEFKKIEIGDLTSINPQRVINTRHNFAENIYYIIDKCIFNSIKKNNAITITKNSDLGDAYIVFAVKTLVKGFDEVKSKYDYYIVYCHNGNIIDNCGLFEDVKANVEIKILGSGNNLTNIGSMFYGGENLTKITFNSTCFDTSKVTDMSYMFQNCKKLEELDLSTFDTSNVTNMSNMFDNCKLLTSLNVSNFNTINVTDMSNMFKKCKLLTKLNVSNFSTINVTDMSNMFKRCEKLEELNLSNFDTSNVTNMSNMFEDCKLLTKLNVSRFNTGKVTNMGIMFAGCTNLTSLILPNKVIYDNVTKSYENMFYGCEKLSREKVTTNDTKIYNMF